MGIPLLGRLFGTSAKVELIVEEFRPDIRHGGVVRTEHVRTYSQKDVERGITIGRSEGNDIVVQDNKLTARRVSRTHARIIVKDGALRYEDVSSVGTVLEIRGSRVRTRNGDTQELHEGDRMFFVFLDDRDKPLVGTVVTVRYVKLS